MSKSPPPVGSAVNEKQNVGLPMIRSSGCDRTAAIISAAVAKICSA
jgi:hypothetical protein